MQLEHKDVSLCWLMVWRYVPVKILDEKTNYITNLVAINSVLIFQEFAYRCEWVYWIYEGSCGNIV